jgi:hypothetical protein
MKAMKTQKGFIGGDYELTGTGLVLVLFVILTIVLAISGIYYHLDATKEEIASVNKVVKLAKNEPFASTFNKRIENYLKDGRISKEEADKIIKEYETLKLKQEVLNQTSK